MVNGTARVPGEHAMEEERKTAEWLFGGSMTEALIAGGAVALSIIGLAGVFPSALLSIATIVLGGALLLEGSAIVARIRRIVEESGETEAAEVPLGATSESIGGAAGVALGILSVLGLIPSILLPIAAIVIGGCVIFGAGTNARLDALAVTRTTEHPMVHQASRQAVRLATGTQVFVGLSAIALGIIALSGVDRITLTLIAILALSASLLLSGSAVAGRMLSAFRA